jgi:hypothetical protein
MVVPVAEQPRLADRAVNLRQSAEQLHQPAATPEAVLEDRSEQERIQWHPPYGTRRRSGSRFTHRPMRLA